MADTFEIEEGADAPDHHAADDHHVVHESTGIDNRKLGMWVFLSSEFLFFGAFISNYLLYGNRDFDSVVPRDIYDIPFTSISSFVLLMSSLTMVLAHHALSTGDQNGTKTWLMARADRMESKEKTRFISTIQTDVRIIHLLVQGYTNAGIAATLGTTEKSIRNRRYRIKRQLRVACQKMGIEPPEYSTVAQCGYKHQAAWKRMTT